MTPTRSVLRAVGEAPADGLSLRQRLDKLREHGYDEANVERVEKRFRCTVCRDSKRVEQEVEPGLKRSVRCETCAPQADEVLEQAGVPREQRRASLTSDVHAQNAEIAASLSELVDARFEVEGSARSLYLFGGYGTGKTWMAAGTCRAVVERLKWSVGWVTVRDLLRELQAIYQSQQRDDGQGRSEWEILRRYQIPRLLVLNELPRTRVSPWVAEQIEGLVDFRINEHRPTILTGNVEASEIETLYNGALASRLKPLYFDRIRFADRDLREGA